MYNGLDVYYREGTEDERVLDHSFEKDIFLKEIPYFRFNRNPVVVDVGAHIGTFSMKCYLRFPEVKILSFEASKESYEILRQNILNNGLSDRVKTFHEAVASENGTVKLFHDIEKGNWGHTITKKISEDYETVKSSNLATIFENNGINNIDLIKFNCEGAEFDIIINSPIEILEKINLAIILYHCDLVKNFTKRDLIDRLENSQHSCSSLFEKKDRGWIISVNKKKYNPLAFNILSKIKRRIARG